MNRQGEYRVRVILGLAALLLALLLGILYIVVGTAHEGRVDGFALMAVVLALTGCVIFPSREP